MNQTNIFVYNGGQCIDIIFKQNSCISWNKKKAEKIEETNRSQKNKIKLNIKRTTEQNTLNLNNKGVTNLEFPDWKEQI